jgi:uncharacterized protein YjbI with pentapeptide repeats
MATMADAEQLAMLKRDIAEWNQWRANHQNATIDLSLANLTHASLINANLRHANFSQADLIGAQFTGADLTGAYLRHADLTDAHLDGTDLRNADLGGAILNGAILKDADLRHTCFVGAHVTQEQLDSAKSHRGALLPRGLH